MIDLLNARETVESEIKNISGFSGTGVSFGEKKIIIYTKDYNAESEIRNKIGDSYEGFPLRFVMSGKVIMFQ